MRDPTKKELRRGPERGENISEQRIFQYHCSTKHANLRNLYNLQGKRGIG